jgi:hypothetical protein
VHAPGALDEQDRLAVHGISSTRWISVAFKDQRYRPTLQPSCRISSGAELATNIKRRRGGCDDALRERRVAGEISGSKFVVLAVVMGLPLEVVDDDPS